MSLELNVTGLDKLQSIIESAPAVGIKHANASIIAVIALVENAVKKEAPIGLTKKLHNNWNRNFKPLEGTLSSEQPYASAVEYGTGPHPVSVEEIGPWAISKGLNPYAVAKSISKKGTRANPFFQRALTNSEERANTIIKGTIDNIVNELSK